MVVLSFGIDLYKRHSLFPSFTFLCDNNRIFYNVDLFFSLIVLRIYCIQTDRPPLSSEQAFSYTISGRNSIVNKQNISEVIKA